MVLRHLRPFVRRAAPHPHARLRRRLTVAVILVAIVDTAGTILMWVFENGADRSEIHDLWDALFFSTVQLLTVSSQMQNPVTTGGRVVDIGLEAVALCLVSGIAGAFASFFLHLDRPEQAA